jgi:bacillopeptidase F (M6 metalloprotease family)
MLRDANLKGIKGKVRVNEDGSSIYHNDKLINQYTIKSASHSKGYYCCSIENNQFYTHALWQKLLFKIQNQLAINW